MEEDLAPVDMAWVDSFLGLEKEFLVSGLNSLTVVEKSDGVSGKIDGEDISFNSHLIKRDLISVNAKNQLKEIENLAEKCCQVQISNKKGNCIVEDENLAFKSTYLTLRKDKILALKLFSNFPLGRGENLNRVIGNNRVGIPIVDNRVADKRVALENGLETVVKWVERPTQNFKMKAQSGKMAVSGPVVFCGLEHGLRKNGPRNERPGYNGSKTASPSSPDVGNFKNNFKLSLNLEEEISRIIRVGVALGLDFDGKKVWLAAVFAEVKRKLKLDGLRELKVQ
ncbi:hypothetical protein LWI28_010220 [Acer negundo]|uniref:Uncharacterized protein n=1 Tax=Acer negundo TaxID=4023 RepID=A0AAD5IE04_ACENE|nr:hypothetical protein LWI28_010220 [Acer negundo]